MHETPGSPGVFLCLPPLRTISAHDGKPARGYALAHTGNKAVEDDTKCAGANGMVRG